MFNNSELAIAHPPVMLGETVYVPLQDLAAALRMNVVPQAVTSALRVHTSEGTSLIVQQYSKKVLINDEVSEWTDHPVLYKGIMYVPAREFCAVFGYRAEMRAEQVVISGAAPVPESEPAAPQVKAPSLAVDDAVVVMQAPAAVPAHTPAPLPVAPQVRPVPDTAPERTVVHTYTTGRYVTVTANSCWLPDLTSVTGPLCFNVRGRVFRAVGEDVRQGVLYVPAQQLLGPFDYVVRYTLPGRHISITRTAPGRNERLDIDEGALQGTFNGIPVTFSRPFVMEEGHIRMPLVEVLRVLRIGCRWGSLEDKTVYVEPLIDEVYLQEEGGIAKVIITGSEPIEVKKAVELKDPFRIVLDIPHSVLNVPRSGFKVPGASVRAVRVSQFTDDTTRVVIELASPRTYGLGADVTGREIVVDFVPWLTKVGVFADTAGAGVRLHATSPLEVQQKVLTDPDRVVLTIPGCVLKTNGFVSSNVPGILRVRASQFSWQPLMTRVVVDLDGPHTYALEHGAQGLVIRFSSTAAVLPGRTLPSAGTVPAVPVVPLVTPEAPEVQATVPAAAHVPTRALSVGPRSLKGKRIIIDPGHGGSDPGAISRSGVNEKDLTLQISKILYKLLLDDGALPFLVIEDDTFMGMEDRARFAERNNADAVISLHLNSFIKPTVRGVETYWYKDNDLLLAQAVHAALLAELRLPDKGIKQSQMYILNHTTMPGALIEPCYLSNPEDEALIRTEQFRYNIAVGIRNGLQDYFSKRPSSK